MAMPAAYKPSPLGYGSPRSSPFRRPESPASPSASSPLPLRQTTPSGSPTKAAPFRASTSRFAADPVTPTKSSADDLTPKGTPRAQETPADIMLASPRAVTRASPSPSPTKPPTYGNALGQLQQTQVRTLREGFEILDRDSDGVVNREDVADMLNQLGLPADASDVSKFFPPSAPQTITMAAFLNSVASMLAALSAQSELISAFSAFDDDDSGQIDLAELRDALLHTAPESGERPLTAAEVDKVIEGFTGRRAFSRNMQQGGLGKRGEVFRYQDFVNSIMGANGNSESSSAEGSED
ncbi:EF-hand [Sodiomyces alkalinus F11]|uniref:EF-hand n=1 Tax=Sodiomyces alkalinus (strain CBS 110278 / VKM F-3762 / F11) TaxID=1314773 RepID=A0A3N2PVN4_SODAK|nr:EF-hand [Sodiomyces alkalinus F11]ROT38559.1 EF-hand [Sodiomyces alkalinus F11]